MTEFCAPLLPNQALQDCMLRLLRQSAFLYNYRCYCKQHGLLTIAGSTNVSYKGYEFLNAMILVMQLTYLVRRNTISTSVVRVIVSTDPVLDQPVNVRLQNVVQLDLDPVLREGLN